jgi:hypothetical protein
LAGVAAPPRLGLRETALRCEPARSHLQASNFSA